MDCKKLQPVDILNLLFFSLLFILSLLCTFRNVDALPALIYYAGLVLLLLSIFWSSQKYGTKFLAFVHDWHPLLYLFLVFGGFAYLLPCLNKEILDYLFIKMDRRMFGVDPTVWLEQFQTPLLTDFMHIAYAFYFLMPAVLLITLHIKGKRSKNREAIFVMLAGAYICYIGYFIFPAIGPRFTLDWLQKKPIDGSAITHLIRRTIEILEPNNRDVFPSAHIALSMAMTHLAWRFCKGLFPLFLITTILTFLTTVYCRYHYVIDLFAGVAFGVLIIFAAPRLYTLIQRWRGADALEGIDRKNKEKHRWKQEFLKRKVQQR
jgi:membrane-associated phospholipid phosphatase